MRIDKQFHFSYGHRVHNQSLDHRLSCQGLCKCRHLHGHNAIVKLVLEASDDGDMVLDFNNFKLFENAMDEIFDHKFVVDIRDPLLDKFLDISLENLKITHNYKGFGIIQDPKNEIQESFVFVDFVPTSENLCKSLYKLALEIFGEPETRNFKIHSIEFWETPKTHCAYTTKEGN